MERLRQQTLVGLSPCVSSSYLSLSVYNSFSRVFFLPYGDAPPFGTTIIIPIGEQAVLCHTMGGHNTQVFLARA